MNRPPFDLAHSLGPGTAAAEARVRAHREATWFNHARATNALWEAEQRPLQPHLRAALARTFAEVAHQAAQRQPGRHL